MKHWIFNGNVYVDGRFIAADLGYEDGRITDIVERKERGSRLEEASAKTSETNRAASDEPRGGYCFDAGGEYVIPGFFDIHTHGAAGHDVNASDREDFQAIGHFKALHGTTSWFCSILTDTEEQTSHCIREAVAHMRDHEDCANLQGIHLEGPFLEKEYKGAMPEWLLREADYDLTARYQEQAEGNIRYMTVSPMVKGVPELIPELLKLNIKVAIGHSGADYDTAWKCIRNGASCATHTFNAMGLFHQHQPAIMGACLESDIYCEAICDGLHLHPGAVRFLLKMKGFDRVVAITDSIMAAGLKDGRYKLGVNDVIVKNSDARLAEGNSRVGSTLTMDRALRNLLSFTGRPLEEILPLLTINPAKAAGMDDQIGSLEVGKQADVVILDSEYQVMDTFVKGERIDRSRTVEEVS